MKYHNKKTTIDGITFDSKREAQYYLYYKKLSDAGKIKNLKLQVPFEFKLNGKKMFTYKADFTYEDDTGLHVIDVKGVETPVFRLKKKIIEQVYGNEIEIVR